MAKALPVFAGCDEDTFIERPVQCFDTAKSGAIRNSGKWPVRGLQKRLCTVYAGKLDDGRGTDPGLLLKHAGECSLAHHHAFGQLRDILAWRLLSGKIEATNTSSYGRRVHSHVSAELGGDPSTGFRRLERAHVLGQSSTMQHVRVHFRMLMWGMRRRDRSEVIGQVLRLLGAAAGTWLGRVPHGNTGGANVSAFKSMAIPDDLAGQIMWARSHSLAGL